MLTLAPKNRHPFLMAYFSSVEPAKYMAGELKALEWANVLLSPAHPDRGVVLLARYVDNIYISIL